MSDSLDSQMTLSWLSASIALLPLALNAVLADSTPLLGWRQASSLWRVSPVVCLYDIVWKLVGLLLVVRPRQILQPDVVPTVKEGKIDPDKPSDPEKLALHDSLPYAKVPETLAEEEEDDPPRRPAFHFLMAKWILHVISATQAVKLMACDGVIWTQIFAMIYMCHWFLAAFAPQPKATSIHLRQRQLDLDLRHRLTMTAFQGLVHLLSCTLFIPTVAHPQHAVLIASGFAAAFALGALRLPEPPKQWISVFFHYVVMAQAAILAYTPAVLVHASDHTTTTMLVASVDGMSAVLTMLLGWQGPPGKWAARSFFACGLIIPLVLSAVFWNPASTFKPEWANWLG